MLHHAAANGCPEALKKMIQTAKGTRQYYDDKLYKADCSGMTPVMHVLRSNKKNDHFGYPTSRFAALKKKLNVLLAKCTTREQKLELLFTQDRSSSSALVHAACGGWEAFNLAVETIYRLQLGVGSFERDCEFFDKALGHVESSPVLNQLLIKRRSMLMEAAAKSGDMRVLKEVVTGLETVVRGG